MESRHAVQSVLRSASSRSAVTNALLAMRAASPIRQQSSAATAVAEKPAPTNSASIASQLSTRPVWTAKPTAPDDRHWTRPRAAFGGGSRNTADSLIRIFPSGLKLGSSLPKMASAHMAGNMQAFEFNVQDWVSSALPRAEFHRRLCPSLGRSVPIGQNVDVARGFYLLGAMVRRNKLPKTVAMQRFHERPGLRRKRLKMERWRVRFRAGFKATVNRVRALSMQGW